MVEAWGLGVDLRGLSRLTFRLFANLEAVELI